MSLAGMIAARNTPTVDPAPVKVAPDNAFPQTLAQSAAKAAPVSPAVSYEAPAAAPSSLLSDGLKEKASAFEPENTVLSAFADDTARAKNAAEDSSNFVYDRFAEDHAPVVTVRADDRDAASGNRSDTSGSDGGRDNQKNALRADVGADAQSRPPLLRNVPSGAKTDTPEVMTLSAADQAAHAQKIMAAAETKSPGFRDAIAVSFGSMREMFSYLLRSVAGIGGSPADVLNREKSNISRVKQLEEDRLNEAHNVAHRSAARK